MSSTPYPADLPVFRREGDLLLPGPLANGPWYPGTQHGSAMMLMAALAAERQPSDQPRQVVRLTVDMLKAAPMAAIRLNTTTRKQGYHMDALDISLTANGDECVRASALRLRVSDVPVNERVRHTGPAPCLPTALDFDMCPRCRRLSPGTGHKNRYRQLTRTGLVPADPSRH